ncbi:MAG: hypothetical protein O3C67_05845 [Cyanobacteria bacterium]|nr:hypothetical protein [Cyanobacteriota bacterium]
METALPPSYGLLYRLLQALQPFLVPLCFVVAWLVMGLWAWSVWAAVRDSLHRARQMHRVPCAGCLYFSGDYHLKCPVHPQSALSEAAIDCPDFEAASPVTRCLNNLKQTP